MADVLSSGDVKSRLALHPGWTYDGEKIAKTFDRGNFDGAIAFVNTIASIANRLDHHPDFAVSWNEVVVRTSSHDVNGISSRDFALIAAIDEL